MVLGNILLGGLPTLTHHSDPRFKAFRKLVQLTLSRQALAKQTAAFDTETRLFLKSLLPFAESNAYGEIKTQIDRFSFSMIVSICFGISLRDVSEDFIESFFHNTDLIFLLAGAATDKQAFFPLLAFWPDPNIEKAKTVRENGTAFISHMMEMSKQKVERMQHNTDVVNEACSIVDEGYSSSTNILAEFPSPPPHSQESESIMEMIIRNPSLVSNVDTESLTDMLNNLTVGAVDTVSIAIQWCVAFLKKYPESLHRIHSELDTVIGRTRLPTLQDEPSLHYLNAFLREAQRVRPVSATAVPRVTLTDQTFNGYFIPAGTWVMFDFHGLARNTASYGLDVDEFRPERYLDPETGTRFLTHLDSFNPNAVDGSTSHPRGFSYGRRVCPGKELAQMQLFLAVAGMCQCFEVVGDGSDVDLDAMWPGLTNPPKDLKVSLKERFPGAAALLL
ncbi:cytochrome P450 [Obelidium mucronatum]|nr:cytochrome P450 [Obelidium mucronatum]